MALKQRSADRRAILAYLSKREEATVSEIATALGFRSDCVRRSLRALFEEGSILNPEWGIYAPLSQELPPDDSGYNVRRDHGRP